MSFDFALAMEQYRRRRAYHGAQTRIDNPALPPGAPQPGLTPQVYYCRLCFAPTATLSESHTCAAPTVCHACAILYDHGLLPELPE